MANRKRGLSIRSIADRHGVGQRTVLQALESPIPRPRKRLPPRKSRLDPFKDTIDEILHQDIGKPRHLRRTVKSIRDELINRRGMTDVSYGVLRSYIAHQRNVVLAITSADTTAQHPPT